MKTCIILRNGSEIWIPEEKAKHLSDALIAGNCPKFVKLTDAAGRIINTADIVEFCTAEQMDDKARTKSGEWKCEHGRWHLKKEKCDCARREMEKRREAEEEERRKELERKRTPEEQARISKRLKEMRAELSKKLRWKNKQQV